MFKMKHFPCRRYKMLLQLSWFKGGLSKHNLIQNNKGLCSMYTNPWAAPKDDGIGFTSLLIFKCFLFFQYRSSHWCPHTNKPSTYSWKKKHDKLWCLINYFKHQLFYKWRNQNKKLTKSQHACSTTLIFVLVKCHKIPNSRQYNLFS